jgi:hypothetical protein
MLFSRPCYFAPIRGGWPCRYLARFSGVLMPFSFEQSPLWRRTLAACPADRDCVPRQSLRLAYLQFREAVAPLAADEAAIG